MFVSLHSYLILQLIIVNLEQTLKYNLLHQKSQYNLFKLYHGLCLS